MGEGCNGVEGEGATDVIVGHGGREKVGEAVILLQGEKRLFVDLGGGTKGVRDARDNEKGGRGGEGAGRGRGGGERVRRSRGTCLSEA